jgi:hypothetical protein
MTAVTCGNLRVEIVSDAGIRHARARQAAAAKRSPPALTRCVR